MTATLTAVRDPRWSIAVGANAALLILGVAGYPLVALALAIVVPVAGSILLRPQRGLLLLAALVPFNGLLIIAGLPGFVSGWKEALVLLTLVGTFVAPTGARGQSGRTRPPWMAGVVALFVVALGSGILAVGGVRAVLGLKIGFIYVLVAAAVWRCPLSRRERDRLVGILIAAGAVTAAFGLVQQVLGHGRLHAMGWPYNETIRFTKSFLRSFSTFNQPFAFGFFLMIVLLMGTAMTLEEPARLRSKIFILTSPMMALALFFTFVRGAWLGTAVGVAFLGASRYRVLLLLIPTVMVGVLFIPPEVARPALSSSSTQARTEGWQQNLDAIFAHPLGVGLGTTGAAAEKIELTTGAKTYQPDNYYFKSLYELGLLGLWLFVLLIVAVFGAVRSRARQLNGLDAAFSSGVAATVAAAAVASLVAMYLEIFPMDFYFWFLVGTVASCLPESS